jgi:L-threonylcarbamoyladenylate synthase
MSGTPSTPVGTNIADAKASLCRGGLVAIPTETVYGLAGDASSSEAVARIFAAKQRPWFDPLIVHTSSIDRVAEFAVWPDPRLRKLAEAFWPGPLTVICQRTSRIADLVCSGLDTVGVRVPKHSLTGALLKELDFPVAAPSANKFGRISPTTAKHVQEQLDGEIEYILDGGPCPVGVESTIVAVENGLLTILRFGGIPVEDIEQVVGTVGIAPSILDRAKQRNPDQAMTAPGMLAQHYAPRTPLQIVDAEYFPESPDRRVGFIGLQPPRWPEGFAQIEVLSRDGQLVEAASRFFAALRRLDALGLDLIVSVEFPEVGLGRALNDRLRRAATK